MIVDIEGKELDVGDKIIVEDYGWIFKGEIIKFCQSVIKIKYEQKLSNGDYNYRNRQIAFFYTNKKIYKI